MANIEEPESIIRTILKNEITWLIALIAAIAAFFYNVVIPINSIQFQLAQLQADISQVKSYDSRITQSANDIIRLQSDITTLRKGQ